MPTPRISPVQLRAALRRMVNGTRYAGGEEIHTGAAMGAGAGILGGGAYDAAHQGEDSSMFPVGMMGGMAAGAAGGLGVKAARMGASGIRGALRGGLDRMAMSGASGAAGGQADAMAVGGAQDMNEAMRYLAQYLDRGELQFVAQNASDVSEVPPILRQLGYGDRDFRQWAMNAAEMSEPNGAGNAAWRGGGLNPPRDSGY